MNLSYGNKVSAWKYFIQRLLMNRSDTAATKNVLAAIYPKIAN